MPLSPGEVLNNRYRIVKLLGHGGFGAVYRAWDINLNGPCALKENFETTPAAHKQFNREASILFNLRHHNLPKVFDTFSIPDQGQYLVMEYIQGEDLEQMLERTGGPLPVAQALEWLIQLCDALAYLHGQNPPVIHRDIKPANIRVTPEGQIMLVDFGIAKVYDAQLKTTLGARAVTPGYSPPEQYGMSMTDARSDIYALGATLYMALTGQPPLESVMRMAGNSLRLPRLIRPEIPAEVEQVILKAMDLNPDGRFTSAGEYRSALEQALALATGSVGQAASPGVPPAQERTQVVSSPTASDASAPSRLEVFGVPGAARTPAMQASAPADRTYRPVAPAKSPRAATRPGKSPWLWVGFVGGVVLLGVAILAGLIGLGLRLARPAGETIVGETIVVFKVTATPRASTTPLPERRIDEQGIEMALIPVGEFDMGSTAGEQDERPVHTVYLDNFYIDIYEVTNRLYQVCVAAGKCSEPGYPRSHTRPEYYGNSEFDEFPVVFVFWGQAQAYCNWRGGRLPTEAEWEKAARGGLQGKTFPWGDEPPGCSRSNYYGCTGDTERVDAYPPNAYGLYNMAGNAREWVFDWYGETYYASSPLENPQGPTSGISRITHGGSWYSNLSTLRIAARSTVDAGYRGDFTGFRCAWSP